jgi:uncharacterized membrane protein
MREPRGKGVGNAAMVGLYLAAIVAANLLVTRFGARAVYLVAFALIGLDLTLRDRLHEAWRRERLVAKMGVLIASGSAISWLLNRGSARVALASCLAFAAAATADAVTFHLLGSRQYLVRVNGSNVLGALADSVVFPTLAFGSFALAVTGGQFLSKVAGGFLWSLLVRSPASSAPPPGELQRGGERYPAPRR